MPHIHLPAEIPGIGAAFAFRPETAKPMRELARVLLFEPGSEASLTSRDRELIASYVSSRNTCYFCQTSHEAAAASHVGGWSRLACGYRASSAGASISQGCDVSAGVNWSKSTAASIAGLRSVASPARCSSSLTMPQAA